MKAKTVTAAVVLTLAAMTWTGCMRMPNGLSAVEHFEVEDYMGTWYEIARLDHRFERGLNNVSASYTLRDDGSVRVVNRGYDSRKDAWQQAEAIAKLADDPSVGRLKVSFFRPFWASYNILVLDTSSHALVCGPKRSYLWVLARTKSIPAALGEHLVDQAASWGFPTEELIFVVHDRQDPALADNSHKPE